MALSISIGLRIPLSHNEGVFTGLVQCVGRVTEHHSGRLVVRHDFDSADPLQIGESIAVNGCCLTALNSGMEVEFELSEETLRRTNMSALEVGQAVNLERAMRPFDRLGGHIVQGHVDAIARIRSIEAVDANSTKFEFELEDMAGGKYLIDKGSVTMDGISLTVVEPRQSTFSCWIVPHTLKNTNLSERRVGDAVNTEFDVLAKHVERLLAAR